LSWRGILKSEEISIHGEMLVQQLEVLFRGFPVEKEMTPQEEKKLITGARILVKRGGVISPYLRSMKFMQDFPEIKRDGLNFVMSFEVYDQTFTLKKPLLDAINDGHRKNSNGVGDKAGDTFPELENGTRICIKAMGIMTNGDMMVAILLASKNDELPPILTLPAYVERFFPQLKFHDKDTIYNDMEREYKIELIRKILKEVEGLPDEELPTGGIFSHIDGRDIFIEDSIDGLNRILTEYAPNKVLGSW